MDSLIKSSMSHNIDHDSSALIDEIWSNNDIPEILLYNMPYRGIRLVLNMISR